VERIEEEFTKVSEVGNPIRTKNMHFKFDGPVKSQETPAFVIPAKAGIQETQALVDSRFRGSDGLGDFLRDHQI